MFRWQLKCLMIYFFTVSYLTCIKKRPWGGAVGPALRRLSQVSYKAGKLLLAEGNPRQARRYLAKAVKYKPTNLRAWPGLLAAAVASLFAGRERKDK